MTLWSASNVGRAVMTRLTTLEDQISPNSGQTVVNAPMSLAAGGKATFHWRAADAKWRV